MGELLFGVETEYAIAGVTRRGAMEREETLQRMMEFARKELVHLPDLHGSGGMYLGNGARFYLDCGMHPEMCTPECANPWDAVRSVEAGHRIVAGLAARVEAEGKPGRRCAASGATWTTAGRSQRGAATRAICTGGRRRICKRRLFLTW